MSLAGGCDRDGIVAALAAEQGVAILPTDTLPGLHARLDRPLALAEMARLKGRDVAKPFLILVDSVSRVYEFSLVEPGLVSGYLSKVWPGPFTLILAARPGLPAGVVAASGTVAIRVPDPAFLRDLLAITGPLASTSVNVAGAAAAVDVAEAAACFPQLPCWPEGSPAGTGQASALVDLTAGEPRLLRPGPADLPPWGDRLS